MMYFGRQLDPHLRYMDEEKRPPGYSSDRCSGQWIELHDISVCILFFYVCAFLTLPPPVSNKCKTDKSAV